MSSEAVQDIPLDTFCDDRNVRSRLNRELVDQIAASYQLVGQLQPVRARWVESRLSMIDGHHRLAAAYKAGLKTLACIIEEQALGGGDVIQRQLIANCLRENLSTVDTARAIQELMETMGWNGTQVAANLPFSKATVTRLLSLPSLPPPILAQVEAGQISASAAYELSQITDPAKQAELAAQLAEGRLTRDAISGARKAAKRPAKRTSNEPSRVTAILGESRSITVASAGLTLERFIELIEEVLAKARRVRSQGVELGTFVKMLRDQARAG